MYSECTTNRALLQIFTTGLRTCTPDLYNRITTVLLICTTDLYYSTYSLPASTRRTSLVPVVKTVYRAPYYRNISNLLQYMLMYMYMYVYTYTYIYIYIHILYTLQYKLTTWKHSQYFLRHPLFLQWHPFRCFLAVAPPPDALSPVCVCVWACVCVYVVYMCICKHAHTHTHTHRHTHTRTHTTHTHLDACT